MRGRLSVLLVMLLAAPFSLYAQDHPVTVLDGPVVKTDSTRNKTQILPLLGYPAFSGIQPPSFLTVDPFETKEQRAARINALTSANVLSSVDFTTGTYEQVMVKWEDVQKSMATSLGSSSHQYAPIPADPLRPAYWNTP